MTEVKYMRLGELTGAMSVQGDCEDHMDKGTCTRMLNAVLKEAEAMNPKQITPDEARPLFKAWREKVKSVAKFGPESARDVATVIDAQERDHIAAHPVPETDKQRRARDPIAGIAAGTLTIEGAEKQDVYFVGNRVAPE